jgi:hypothetical protein
MLVLRLSLTAAAVFFLATAVSAVAAAVLVETGEPVGGFVAAAVLMLGVAVLAGGGSYLVRVGDPRARLAVAGASVALVVYLTVSSFLTRSASWDVVAETALGVCLVVYWTTALRRLPA